MKTQTCYVGSRPNGDVFLTLLCGEERHTLELDAALGHELGLAVLACTQGRTAVPPCPLRRASAPTDMLSGGVKNGTREGG